ncbi:MAG: H-NS histone family protein [Acidovorax sp.]|nr:H-NS histone family protein [Acidovorax sp.]
MNSYKELLAQRDALEKQIHAAREAELKGAIAKARELIAQFGLNEADIFGKAKAAGERKAANPVAPKYRNPATGATWTGRGKPPLWIAGQDRAQFQI